MKILVFVVLAVLIALVLLRRRTPPQPKSTANAVNRRQKAASKNAGTSTNKPYRSTSIKCGDNPCAEARALEGQRFLLGRAPQLPLAKCDVKACTCKYIHHADRRNDQGDRRQPMALRTNLYGRAGKTERRRGSDQAGRRLGE